MREQAPVGDLETLRRILANTDALLLDFDGPICSIFAGIPAHFVADQLRDVLLQFGHTVLPSDVEKSEDPFDVFQYAATLGKDETRYAEAALRAHEVEAVASAAPTPEAHSLIRAWSSTGKKLAIVSNNSSAAVNAYIYAHQIADLIDTVSARTSPDPTLLKPNPYLVNEAIYALGAQASRCTLVGDSLNDLLAARHAQVATIGFANKPEKVEPFRQGHADAIILRIKGILEAI